MKPRVLFLLACPRHNASSRYRVVKYLPEFARAGLECELREPLPGWARRLERFETGTLPQRGLYYLAFLAARLVHVLQARRFDVVVVQRDLFPFSLGLLEELLHRVNGKVIYDTDDAMHVAPSFISRSPFQKLRPLDKFNHLMRNSCCVVVANEPLWQHASRLNDHVVRVPMSLDVERYSKPHPYSHKAEVVLGWTGTTASFNYLGMLREPLEELSRETDVVLEIVSGNAKPIDLGAARVRRVAWSLEREVEDLAHFDIGLLPLPDTEFERNKFPFKLLQYMALGLPVVASPVGVVPDVIGHGQFGFLASSPEEWRVQLRRLLDDSELRRRIGAAARRQVEEHFSIRRNAPIWVDLIQRAAGAARCRW